MISTTRSSKPRYPVRNPLAGIISDWFGVEGGSAKVLLALYEAGEPITPRTIVKYTGVKLENAKVCISRLRAAGVDIPRAPTRGGASYVLSVHARYQVREAFANALKLLGAEVPDVERIEDLERELGIADRAPQHGLTQAQDRLFALMEKNPLLTRRRAYATLYGDREEAPDPKVLDVFMTHIRKKLAPHGYEVRTVFGVGWELIRREEPEAA